MKQTTEEGLRNLLESGALESHMFNAFYGLAPVNNDILKKGGEVEIYEFINTIRTWGVKRSWRHSFQSCWLQNR